MTVAAKDAFEGGEGERRKGRGAGHRGHGGRGILAGVDGQSPWRRLWQVPLLLAGVTLFGFGIRALIRTIHPVPFDRQVKDVRRLLEMGRCAEAVAQINVLAPYYHEGPQQAQLQMLAGDAHYLAQKKLSEPVAANYQRVEEHYAKAVAWGLEPGVEMNERWGEAALALGEAKVAVEKLESAIAAAGSGEGNAGETQAAMVERHGKELVAAYLEIGQREKALQMIDRMQAALSALHRPAEDLHTIEDRTWGLCKRIEIALAGRDGEASHSAAEDLTRAVTEAHVALNDMHELDPAGRVLVWIGRAELEEGQIDAAERDLKAARAKFALHHVDDGRAALMLARIAQKRGELKEAAELFDAVVVGHPGTSIWAAARQGRAEVSTAKGVPASEEMLGDYRFAIKATQKTESASGEKKAVGKAAEMITRKQVGESLEAAYQQAVNARRLDESLVILALQQEMGDHESAETAHRLATTREQRADELMAGAPKLEGPARADQEAAARHLYAQAAEDYARHAKLTTLDDDISGASLWKAGELLDRAGETQRAIGVFERFTMQRPRDARVPEGLLALGRLYESAGQTDKATAVYTRNIKENPKTPASYVSAVNLARCQLAAAEHATNAAQKKAALDAAEKGLLGLVQDNTDLQPSAREFRESLLALGDMYYRNGDWKNAILRLEEAVYRYPEDPGQARTLFLLGESYRHSAQEIAEALKDGAAAHRPELQSARMERLMLAAGKLERVISMLDDQAREPGALVANTHLTSLEEATLRTCYMDRAACYFERGDYDEAIKLYDQAAARFSDELIAVNAYVQMVNAHLALNRPNEARIAAERGAWVLKRMPESVFESTLDGANRAYYEKLLSLGKS